MTAKKSKSGSFKGYNLKVAVMRNKDSIKLAIAAIGAINLVPPFDWHTLAVSAGVGAVGLVTKLAADAIDFYASEVKLK